MPIYILTQFVLITLSFVLSVGCSSSHTGHTGDEAPLGFSPEDTGILGAEQVKPQMHDLIADSVVELIFVSLKKGWGQVDTKIEGNCSGALIANDVVLTAAHCFGLINMVKKHDPSRELALVVKSFDGTIKRQAVDVKVHPLYGRAGISAFNDMAMVRLESDFYTGSRSFRNIKLDNSGIATPGADVISYGYGTSGYTEEKDISGTRLKPTSNGLNRKVLRVIPRSELSEKMSHHSDAIYIRYRPDEEVGSVCYGDSGGPSFMVVDGEPVLVGTISYGPLLSKCLEEEAALMSVATHYEWIQETLKNWQESRSKTEAPKDEASNIHI